MKKVEGNLSEAYTEQAKGLTIADGKKRSTPLFSVVKHYPPDWKSKLPPDESAT